MRCDRRLFLKQVGKQFATAAGSSLLLPMAPVLAKSRGPSSLNWARNSWLTPVAGVSGPSYWTRMKAGYAAFDSKIIVWGGSIPNTEATISGTGYIFDIFSKSLTQMNSSGSPSARTKMCSVWTGTQFFVWGGTENTGATGAKPDGGMYNPATDLWYLMSDAPKALYNSTAVWTGSRMYVYGGEYFNGSTGVTNNELFSFTPPASGSGGSWNTHPSPTGFLRSGAKSVFTGSKIIIWGGKDETGAAQNDGRVFDTVGDQWVTTPTNLANSGLTPRYHHSAAWTGSKMIIWGGTNSQSLNTGMLSGAIYDFNSDSWATMPNSGINAPLGLYGHLGVIIDSKFFVWGGNATDGSVLLNYYVYKL